MQSFAPIAGYCWYVHFNFFRNFDISDVDEARLSYNCDPSQEIAKKKQSKAKHEQQHVFQGILIRLFNFIGTLGSRNFKCLFDTLIGQEKIKRKDFEIKQNM